MSLRNKIICFILFVFIMFNGCIRDTIEFESIANHKDIVEESEYGKIIMEKKLVARLI